MSVKDLLTLHTIMRQHGHDVPGGVPTFSGDHHTLRADWPDGTHVMSSRTQGNMNSIDTVKNGVRIRSEALSGKAPHYRTISKNMGEHTARYDSDWQTGFKESRSPYMYDGKSYGHGHEHEDFANHPVLKHIPAKWAESSDGSNHPLLHEVKAKGLDIRPTDKILHRHWMGDVLDVIPQGSNKAIYTISAGERVTPEAEFEVKLTSVISHNHTGDNHAHHVAIDTEQPEESGTYHTSRIGRNLAEHPENMHPRSMGPFAFKRD